MLKTEFMKKIAMCKEPHLVVVWKDNSTCQHYLRDSENTDYLCLLETNYTLPVIKRTEARYNKWLLEELRNRLIETEATQTVSVIANEIQDIKENYGEILFEKALAQLGYDKMIDSSPCECGIETPVDHTADNYGSLL